MREYIITKLQGPPDWAAIPCLFADHILWLPDAGIRMAQQICYDETALYIHQIAIEAHIRAELTDPLAPVCQDSCMEFFFCPDPQSRRYFNFEWNLNGCLYLGYHGDPDGAVRLIHEDVSSYFSFNGRHTADGWEINYQVPFCFIRMFFPEFLPKPGVTIRANCYKCGDLTHRPHYLAWNACSGHTPNFHQPADFGLMTFGE